MKKHLFKAGIASLLISASAAALADDTANTYPTVSSQGFYAGLEAGIDSTAIKFWASSPAVVNYSMVGGLFGGFLGFQSPSWNGFNLSLEGFFDGDTANSAEHTPAPFTLYKKSEWGVSLLPGYAVADNSKIYARLGYANAHFKFSGANPVTSADISADTTNKSGAEMGLGYLLGLPYNLGVRAEYDYIYYGLVNAASQDFSETYTSNEFRLGLEWMFAS